MQAINNNTVTATADSGHFYLSKGISHINGVNTSDSLFTLPDKPKEKAVKKKK